MNRFFIIGSPRSGTTMLRLMLNKHEKIVVPPEAGFMTWLEEEYRNYHPTNLGQFLISLFESKKFSNWNVDRELLSSYLEKNNPNNYKDLIDDVYRFYGNFVLGKNFHIMGDKNNFFLNDIGKINHLYNDCRFIHIVRDGRAVAASYQDLAKKKFSSAFAPNLCSSIEDIAGVWVSDVETIDRSFRDIPNNRTLCIRFEDLVLDTKSTLLTISNFLNVSFDENMLHFYQTDISEGLEPAEFSEWKSKNLLPIMPEEAARGDSLNLEDWSLFTELARDVLLRHSYAT